MSSIQQPPCPGPRGQAQELADALARRGLTATVLTQGGHRTHPCVYITSPQASHPDECVYAAPEDGYWWFWWSTLDRIAPLSDITTAADDIAHVLTRAWHLPDGRDTTRITPDETHRHAG